MPLRHPHQEHEERWWGAGILVLVGVLVGHQELNGFLERKMVFKRQLNTGDDSSLKLEGYPKGFVHLYISNVLNMGLGGLWKSELALALPLTIA